MFKNLKVTDILLIGVLGMLVYNTFFINKDIKEIEPAIITIPETTGTSGTQYIEPKIVVVQVPVGNNQSINVDSYWKNKYDQATAKQKDSLYNEAIRINKYSDTLVNDDRITIKGNATTRGALLDFKVDYNIKSLDYTYTPEIIKQRPKLTLDIKQGLQIPSIIDPTFSVPTQVGLTNQKGWSASYQYDWVTQKHAGFIGKSFVIIK